MQLLFVILALLLGLITGVYMFATMVFLVATLTLVLLIAIPCFWLHDMWTRNKPSQRHFG